jgi:hypothetical protein
LYWVLASEAAAESCEYKPWIDVVRVFACETSACRLAALSGAFATSAQPLQNLSSSLAMPLSPGSDSAVSTWFSELDVVWYWPSTMFCARYWRSRNWSRMRV